MGNTNTGKAYVEVLADGKLRVGSEDIIGTIPKPRRAQGDA